MLRLFGDVRTVSADRSATASSPVKSPKTEPIPEYKWTFQQLRDLANALSSRQQMYLATGGLTLIATVVLLVGLIHKRSYVPLYTGLPDDTVQEVTQRLSAKKVDYQLSSNRANILVPSDKLNELRMELAEMGPVARPVVSADVRRQRALPSNGTPDELSTGLADALEDKLLVTLSPIAGAGRLRVSVLVENSTVSSETTQESYDPTKAVLLTSEESQQGSSRGLSSSGPETKPNGTTEGSNDSPADRAPAAVAARNSARSYAVSKTVARMSQPAGSVKRIATAILLDDQVRVDNSTSTPVMTRRKRTPQEIAQIYLLAKTAVGFDEARGDQLTVQNIAFSSPIDAMAAPTPVEQLLGVTQSWRDAARYLAVFALFLLIYWGILRPIKNQMVKTLATMPLQTQSSPTLRGDLVITAGSQLAPPVDVASAISAAAALEAASVAVSQDEVVSKQLKQILVERVTKEPAAASRLIQNWIRQDDAGK